MSQLNDRLNLAKRNLRRSVISINPNIITEFGNKNSDPLYFGIKDTNQIPRNIFERLREDQNFIWHTVDKASDRGRAIDTDLINPVTYRAMTGSSSGGPINILKGINDFAIGTDGGGSVLAPAMSCQLPAIIGSGLGVFVTDRKTSTDGMNFIGSIGVMGKSVSVLKKIMEFITNQELSLFDKKKITIAVPKKGSVTCPDNQDMYEKVVYYLSKIDIDNYNIEEINMAGITDRKIGIQTIMESFESKNCDLIVTCEGPIDVYGYGETLPQLLGESGKKLTMNHGKYLVRAANMCKTTAISVPTEEIASGLLVIGKNGFKHSTYAINLAQKLEMVIQLNENWKRYNYDVPNYSGFQFL